MYDRPFELTKYPIVQFSYKVLSPEPVCLNLFAQVNGKLFELPLTAPPAPDLAATLEGGPKVEFHGKPDAGVRRVEIDLGAILTDWYQKHLGRQPIFLNTTDLSLANASNRGYLLCGFGGNRAGARLCIVDFAIRQREPPASDPATNK